MYEQLYRLVQRDRKGEYKQWHEFVKRNFVYYLAGYGTHLKTIYKKDDYMQNGRLKKR